MLTLRRRRHVVVFPVGSCLCTSPILGLCISPLRHINQIFCLTRIVKLTVSEWVDGDQHMANIGLYDPSVLTHILLLGFSPAYINLRIFEPFLQVIIDRLVRDFT